MARSMDDLKALIMAGDEYRESILIDYLDQEFEIQIKPLTDEGLTNVMRNLKALTAMKKLIGKEVDKDKIADEIMADSDVTEVAYSTVKFYQELCKQGIADPDLARLVPKFRYGLTQKIGERIQTISNVPPGVISGFFGPQTAK